MPDGGEISVRARNVSAAERAETKADLRGDFVAIVVTDTGHGVPDEIAERIFEPFFTTKDVGKGTGLGLSQVYGFATQSGGTVTLKSKVGVGTAMTIYLPRAHMQVARRAALDVLDAGYAAQGRLLVVEDNTEVGDGLAELLGQVGFSVTLVRSAVEAVQMLGSGEEFDLLLTDLVMPGNFNGLQLARLVMLDYPALPVILMTGYSAEVRKASAEGFTILIKPFQMSALITAIRERIDDKVKDGMRFHRRQGLRSWFMTFSQKPIGELKIPNILHPGEDPLLSAKNSLRQERGAVTTNFILKGGRGRIAMLRV